MRRIHSNLYKLKTLYTGKHLATLIVTNTLLMFFCVFVLNFHYETNDDPAIIALLNGAYGMSDYHVEYMSSCLGWILQKLFSINPYFNWHTLMLLSLAYISFNIICYVLFLIKDKLHSVYPYAVTLTFLLAPCFYTVLQFTRVSAICIIAGFLLILATHENSLQNKISVRNYVIAGIIILAGSMIRFSILLTIGLIFTPIFVSAIIRSIKLHRFVSLLVSICVTGSLCLMFNYWDKSNYTSPEYKYWSDYSDEEVELMDHGWPDYEVNKALYEELGISENSYTNYILWDFDDSNYINVDSMKKLIDAKEYCVYYLDSISDINWNIVMKQWILYISRLYKHCFFPLLLAGIFLTAFFNTPQKKLTILTILMLPLAELFLAFMQRGLLARIDIGLFTAIIFVCIFLMQKKEVENTSPASLSPAKHTIFTTRAYNLLFAICIICFIVGFGRNQLEYRESENNLATKQTLFNIAAGDKSHTYIYSTLDSVPLTFNMWCTNGVGYQDNLISLGGWTTGAPAKENQKKLRNINNLFADMVDRDDVYYIVLDSDINLKLDYINEHYSTGAKAIPLKRLYGATMYKIISAGKDYPDSKNLQSNYCSIFELKKKGSDISFNYTLSDSEDTTSQILLGTVIVDDYNSYSQEIILSIKDKQGCIHYYPTVQIVNDDYADGDLYRYSNFVYEFTPEEIGNLDLSSLDILFRL